MLIFCDFILVYVFTTNHHLNILFNSVSVISGRREGENEKLMHWNIVYGKEPRWLSGLSAGLLI